MGSRDGVAVEMKISRDDRRSYRLLPLFLAADRNGEKERAFLSFVLHSVGLSRCLLACYFLILRRMNRT